MFYLFANGFDFYTWNKTVFAYIYFYSFIYGVFVQTPLYTLSFVLVFVHGVGSCGSLWSARHVLPSNFHNSLFEHHSTKPKHKDLESSCFYLPSAVWAISRATICLFFHYPNPDAAFKKWRNEKSPSISSLPSSSERSRRTKG